MSKGDCRPPRARIGINGFGHITRLLVRCAIADKRGLDVVAINAPGITPEQLIYMIKYDSQYGPCPGVVSDKVEMIKPDKNTPPCLFIEVCGRKIAYFDKKCPNLIPWQWLNVEYVIETNSNIKTLGMAEVKISRWFPCSNPAHLRGGRARKVIVTGDTVDIPVMIYPISYKSFQRGTSIISAGSPHAMALATILYVLHKQFGIRECMTTITSSYIDNQKTEWRMGRGAFQSIIPMPCGSILQTVLQAIPRMRGKLSLSGFSVPTATGSVADLTCSFSNNVPSVQELAKALKEGNVLKNLANMHEKCQPGWLLQYWCPEEMEGLKKHLPKIECTVKTEPKPEFHLPTFSDDESPRQKPARQIKKEPTSPRFFADQTKERPTPVMEIWEEDHLGVSADVKAAPCMAILDANSCLAVDNGSLMKIISWYDKDMSYCLRIMDTIVFMRHIDHS
ncbi:unnamed protein product [Dibothriocephalus latus]|uniref:Glyceraldehyde 3-phosphate dehydrogenase NAD(P) binding domain-containing protein n=1 Tax=Dibothriocephalus latus TaxID=60516 RepID=A0A3P6SY95_DIBLA|nr:unnamed protein product [Dibothriocephalus latus]